MLYYLNLLICCTMYVLLFLRIIAGQLCFLFIAEISNSVKDIDRVGYLRETYVKALESYCNLKYGDGCRRFSRLVMKILYMREINLLQSDSEFSLQFPTKGSATIALPNILADYFQCIPTPYRS